MTTVTSAEIDAILDAQRTFFSTGKTLDISFRKRQLLRLAQALKDWEGPLQEALWKDLHKSAEEAFLTETSIIQSEIRHHLSHLERWAAPVRRRTPLKMFPSKSRIVTEPLGTSLIISPWNYPVHLLLNPLVGAISAGCTAVLKPSPYVPDVSSVLQDMLESCFDKEYVAVVQGHREVNTMLLERRFDMIFFTGSPALGRTVMAAAAGHLTPVVLELGGKSPCIVDEGACLETAARRIAWGKTLNAGQTCIAPDYLLVRSSLKEPFIRAFAGAVKELHGEDPSLSPHYVRMVSDQAFDRVAGYLSDGKVVHGGRSDRESRYLEPTLLDEVDPASPVMTEEIFGPVLPILTFKSTEEAVRLVNSREKPLALYYFGRKDAGLEVVRRTSSGGACINDTVMHIVNGNLPFGGVGNSGMGHYHGKSSFEAFSHRKAVVTTPVRPDLPFRYMPYRMFGWLKKLMPFFSTILMCITLF